MICTYNGRAHDLAVPRQRGAGHWMFGLPGIAGATPMDQWTSCCPSGSVVTTAR